jgi:hypothetical protein
VRPRGGRGPGADGGALAAVAGQRDDPQAGFARPVRAQQFCGVVGGAVVDDDQLVKRESRGRDGTVAVGCDVLKQCADPSFLVVRGDDDRQELRAQAPIVALSGPWAKHVPRLFSLHRPCFNAIRP